VHTLSVHTVGLQYIYFGGFSFFNFILRILRVGLTIGRQSFVQALLQIISSQTLIAQNFGTETAFQRIAAPALYCI
jgi:hypothetical protein